MISGAMVDLSVRELGEEFLSGSQAERNSMLEKSIGDLNERII